jgi:NAD(P)H-dependent FMN reductase
MSGPFKNAIDWESRMKGAFSGKVAGTMGAGGGQKINARAVSLQANCGVLRPAGVE